jgi:hypothetical protein
MSSLESSSLDIRLKKSDRLFKVNDKVEGFVVVNAKGGWAHKGISNYNILTLSIIIINNRNNISWRGSNTFIK